MLKAPPESDRRRPGFPATKPDDPHLRPLAAPPSPQTRQPQTPPSWSLRSGAGAASSRQYLREEEIDYAAEILFAAARACETAGIAAAQAAGVSEPQWRILVTLAPYRSAAMADLRERLGASKQALHAPIDDLCARGFVAIAVDRGDRRRRTLSMTESGHLFYAQLAQNMRARIAAALRAAGPEDSLAARRVLAALSGAKS